MPIISQSPKAISIKRSLSDLEFQAFPSHETRVHLINLIKRDLLDGKEPSIKSPFKKEMLNGFKLLVNEEWWKEGDAHPIYKTDTKTGFQFVDISEPTPRGKSKILEITKKEIDNWQNGIQIYYDLESIKKISPEYNDLLMVSLIEEMMNVKKGDIVVGNDKVFLKKVSPHILFRFESKQIFDFYATLNDKAQEGGEIKILDPNEDKRAFTRPFYFNHMPQLQEYSPDFEEFSDQSGNLKNHQALKEKYQAAADLQLFVAAKNNEGCFFLEPSAFLSGLNKESRNEAKKLWLCGVFDALVNFENKPELAKNLGRIFVQPSFTPKQVKRDEAKIKHLHVYFTKDLDCAKVHAHLGEELNIAQPLMGHPLHAVGNGALGSGANNAAEENLYRQMGGLMALVMSPQNNKNLSNYSWLKQHSIDASKFNEQSVADVLGGSPAKSSSIVKSQGPGSTLQRGRSVNSAEKNSKRDFSARSKQEKIGVNPQKNAGVNRSDVRRKLALDGNENLKKAPLQNTSLDQKQISVKSSRPKTQHVPPSNFAQNSEKPSSAVSKATLKSLLKKDNCCTVQ